MQFACLYMSACMRPLTLWWNVLVMQTVCVRGLAATPLLLKGQTDVTLRWRRQQTIMYPFLFLPCVFQAHPLYSHCILSVLLSEPQTAAAQGSETENTVIVSDENRGAQWEGNTKREQERERGSQRMTEQGEKRMEERHTKIERALEQTIFKVTLWLYRLRGD